MSHVICSVVVSTTYTQIILKNCVHSASVQKHFKSLFQTHTHTRNTTHHRRRRRHHNHFNYNVIVLIVFDLLFCVSFSSFIFHLVFCIIVIFKYTPIHSNVDRLQIWVANTSILSSQRSAKDSFMRCYACTKFHLIHLLHIFFSSFFSCSMNKKKNRSTLQLNIENYEKEE